MNISFLYFNNHTKAVAMIDVNETENPLDNISCAETLRELADRLEKEAYLADTPIPEQYTGGQGNETGSGQAGSEPNQPPVDNVSSTGDDVRGQEIQSGQLASGSTGDPSSSSGA